MLLTVSRKLSVGISSVYLFRNLHRLRAPRRGARFSARTGIGGSITKSCVQTKSAADARPAAVLGAAAPDAGLRAYLKPAFLRCRRYLMVMSANRSIISKMRLFYGGRPLVARPSSVSRTKSRRHFRKRKTPVFTQTFIRRENPYLQPC